MAAPRSQGEATLNPVEVRLSGGMLALVRFLMTLQNKRMPVSRFTVGRETHYSGEETLRITVVLDCPPESAHRYALLLSALEDVEGIEEGGETMEVSLLKVGSGETGEAPEGIELHEEGGTVVATGPPRQIVAWLASMGDGVEDLVRLGPVARPGIGGG